jgi:type IV secretory pathway TrbF-like protein
MRRFSSRLALLGLALALAACGPSISQFNAQAYEHATSLKVDALALMEAATEPYAQHEADVQQLRTDLRKAYEFARGRPNNEISARQWDILIDPERDLLGGFLRDWQERSTLSAVFVTEKKAQVAEAFDTIIELESGKRNPESVQAER